MAPARPADLPLGRELVLPRAVQREIERTAPKAVAADVIAAVNAAAEIAEQDPARALTWLRWARDVAGRSVSVLEATAITAYLAEDWSEVVRTVRAYRRLAGREDQNHILADALRAQGRPISEFAEVVEAMDDNVPVENLAEGRIVWAAALADAGDPRAGLVVLQTAIDRLEREEPGETHVRVWYVAGDLAARAEITSRAIDHFQRALDLAGEDPWDIRDRLRALGAS